MDNILKKTIREVIKNYDRNKNEDNPIPNVSKTNKTTKVHQTERRLGNLISKIRSKSIGSNSSTSTSKKTKKLQVKYERYDPVQAIYKIVKQSDGGGPRFLDVECLQPVSFEEIREIATGFYFDKSGCNNVMGSITECCVTINNSAGQFLDEDNNLWDYLSRKGVLISKTVFILRSCDNSYFNGENDNDNNSETLPDPFGHSDNIATGNEVFTSKRKICPVCNCTYTGESCLICEQNAAYVASLSQGNKKPEYDLFYEELPPDESPDHLYLAERLSVLIISTIVLTLTILL